MSNLVWQQRATVKGRVVEGEGREGGGGEEKDGRGRKGM